MLLLLVAVTAVPLAALLALQVASEARVAVEAAEHAVQDLADDAAIETEVSLREADRTLRVLAMRPQVRALHAGRCDPLFAEEVILGASTTVLASFDTAGKTVCSSLGEDESRSINVADDAWFRAVMASGNVVLGSPQTAPAAQGWVSFMAVPIRSASGDIAGALAVAIDLADFWPITGSRGLPEAGVLAIVDRAGFVVSRYPDAGRSIGRDAAASAIGRAALARHPAPLSMVGSDGVERFYAYEPVADRGWVVVAGVPTTQVFHPLMQSLWRNGLGVLLAAALIAALAFAIYRRISQPLRALGATARAIADGDLTQRTALDGPREISEVARSFNHMVERILGVEVALREREDHYRRLFLASPEAICVVAGGRVLLANPAAVNLFGGSVNTSIGREFLDFVHPDDRARTGLRLRGVLALAEGVVTTGLQRTDALQGAPNAGAPDREVENVRTDVRLLRANGAVVVAELDLLPFAIEGTAAVMTMATDVSRRRRLEDEVQGRRDEVERLVNRQVAVHTALAVAHELNQPLGAVSAYCEAALLMLRQGNWSPERLRHALERGVEQAHRAGTSLHELVDFLQREEAPEEPFDLASVLREALLLIRTERYDFDLKLQVAPDIPPVNGRRAQVIKAIVNLLHNAVEATRAAGFPNAQIAVTATASGNMARVCVEDTGAGLDSNAVRQLFTPFFSTKPGGMGLGLVITRALVEAQGGRLWHAAAAGHPGTAFQFTLPLAT